MLKFLKFLALPLFATILIGQNTTAHASDIGNEVIEESEVSTYIVPEEEQESALEEDIQNIMAEKDPTYNPVQEGISLASNSARDGFVSIMEVPQYKKYDYVKLQTKTVSGSGYAGKQAPKGERFRTGGGFYWSTSGGPSVSPSVSFGGKIISVGVSLGNSASSGRFVTVPNKTNFFKLKTKKTYKVVKTAVYGYPMSGGSRKFLYYIYPKTLQTQEAWAVKQ